MEHSEKIDELGSALSKAQGILEAAKKDSNNPFFNLNMQTWQVFGKHADQHFPTMDYQLFSHRKNLRTV